MRSENYIAFFTVSGFFVGLIFSIIEFDDIFYFLFYTLSITLFFYLFIHLVLILFINAQEKFHIPFDKWEYENFANEQISLLKTKEDQVTTLLKSINESQDLKSKGAKG